MRYYPIVRNGETVGYLWASKEDDAASCLRRLAKKEESLRAYHVWNERLKASKAEGLTPLQALRRWAGTDDGGEGGRLDVPEREASTLAELREIANPGHVDPIEEERRANPLGSWRQGTSPIVTFRPRDFPKTTEGPVRYVSVMKDGDILGYLWASTADDAASYMYRVAAGDDGFNSAVPWRRALRAALEYGMTPMQALHHAIGTPQDDRAGGIPTDTLINEAPNLAALRSIAQVQPALGYVLERERKKVPPGGEEQTVTANYPEYYLYEDIPVVFIETPDGGLDCLALSNTTGEFERDMRFVHKIHFGTTADIQEVNREEFLRHVEEYRSKHL
ncbi:hypothetical protein BJF79_45955 [Actinomadura sp. CNU-125]|uniref:hypothetical protein n=1 Tax=Actinomadura sp. CNU-125 TaxID=1904961 RepID=UPI00096740EB|nr:hypothetical protein [Actinomadura sp. CNU-125]OLT23508.1 hypothetical protein BJF79_45955 [Actinomadura sp. CNU-125]